MRTQRVSTCRRILAAILIFLAFDIPRQAQVAIPAQPLTVNKRQWSGLSSMVKQKHRSTQFHAIDSVYNHTYEDISIHRVNQ